MIRMADDLKDANTTDSLGSSLVKAESVLQLALAVPVGCFVGLALGWWLDKKFHTHWIVVVGMLLGATGGFIQIFQYVSRAGRSGRKDV